MIKTGADHLLFIEPSKPCSAEPVIDSVTCKMAGAWRAGRRGHRAYRGYHVCTGLRCGAESDNYDHFVTTIDGRELVTNSLAIHYLAYHRAEVPHDELAKVARLLADEAKPKTKQLAPVFIKRG